MKVTYKDSRCTIIKFDERQTELRKQGWLGDEEEARVFVTDGIAEIRIFKHDGESYVLNPDSKDMMVRMKAAIIMKLHNQQ